MSNLPAILFVKRKKNRNPRGAQAFFSKKSQLFFGMAGAGKFWVLGRFVGLGIFWFWGVWEVQKAI